ncbi:MAG TPA: DMT family transporter [Terriglobia bacterium]|nr:DMT family transporter [Terriglobia bacterium]
MISAVPAAGSSNALKALLFMGGGVFGFSVLDAVTKLLTEGYGTWQIMVLSRICPVLTAVFLAQRSSAGGMPFRTGFALTHAGRAVLVVATTWCFYECLRYLQLADAIAIAFAAPLFMTSLSGPLLGEKVGARRWSAVLIGFVGVMVALQPGKSGISWGAFLALAAAATYALGQLWLRPLSGKEQGHNILFYSSVFSGLVGLVPTILEWKTPSLGDWLLFLIQGSCSAGAQLCMIRAFKIGEASLLAPLEYTALLWATIFGFAFWGQLPSIQVLGGAGIIIASSLYIAHREVQQGRKRPADVTVPEQVIEET